MRLGILADIHGHTENLKKAIAHLTREAVDKFVVLGDVIYDRRDATEIVAMLKEVEDVKTIGYVDLVFSGAKQMARMRRIFSAAFKVKVALEAISEQRKIAELAQRHMLHATQINL